MADDDIDRVERIVEEIQYNRIERNASLIQFLKIAASMIECGPTQAAEVAEMLRAYAGYLTKSIE